MSTYTLCLYCTQNVTIFQLVSSFLLSLYCPQNAAILHPPVVSFFVHIVRKMQRYLFVSSFPLCLYCPQNAAIFHPSVVCFFAYIVRIIQRRFMLHLFPSLCMLSAKCSDFTSASSFILCIYCPQNAANFHPSVVSFFVYIVRKNAAIIIRP